MKTTLSAKLWSWRARRSRNLPLEISVRLPHSKFPSFPVALAMHLPEAAKPERRKMRQSTVEAPATRLLDLLDSAMHLEDCPNLRLTIHLEDYPNLR